MSSVKKSYWTETLPDPLPANPLLLASQWLTEALASRAQPNPNAMVLASVDSRGRPSARVVLCKALKPDPGCIEFYTNYESRKGMELTGNPYAAAVFHWDHVHRQVRIEGPVELMSAADNDAYFESRAWQSRLGAWASHQSQPVASRAELAAAVTREAQRFGIDYRGPGSPVAYVYVVGKAKQEVSM
jgi:pyridoxamine 5'-phosphate oxidase